MSDQIRQLAVAASESPRRFDIPVFIGPAKIAHKEAIVFLDSERTLFKLSAAPSDVVSEIKPTLCYWKQMSDAFTVTVSAAPPKQLSMSATVIDSRVSKNALLTCFDANGALCFSCGLTNLIAADGKVIHCTLEQALPVGSYRCCFLDLVQESVAYTYSKSDHSITLSYASKIILSHSPLTAVAGLKLLSAKTFVEYVVQTSSALIDNPLSGYGEQDADILIGLNASPDAIVIPAYNESDVDRVVSTLEASRCGYYLTPIKMPETIVRALIAFAGRTKDASVIVPAPDIQISSSVTTATYVKH